MVPALLVLCSNVLPANTTPAVPPEMRAGPTVVEIVPLSVAELAVTFKVPIPVASFRKAAAGVVIVRL